MKKTYLYGAMAFGLLFTGCKADDPLIEPDQSDKNVDRTLYINMSIHGDSMNGTRANGSPVDPTDFDAGTNESDVQNAFFVFYDSKGNMVGEIVEVKLSDPKPGATGTSVSTYYESTVPVAVYKGEEDPKQVICYINPITPASLQNPLNTIQTNTREILYTKVGEGAEAKRYFAMSNSVYYPSSGSGFEVADNETPQIAVPIASTQLFTTLADAQSALDAANNATNPDLSGVVDIYVERYAAKLTFSTVEATDFVTATSLINNPAEIPVTLSFDAKAWILNGACQNTYVVKSFREEGDGSTPLPSNYSYGDLNTKINSFFSLNNGSIQQGDELTGDDVWAWNAPRYHRSYWGMSPAYFTSEYPEVSSDVDKSTHITPSGQYYYSYDQLIDATGALLKGKNPNETITSYFHETTVGQKALASNNPAAAVASVILVGDYTVDLNGTTLGDGTTFYSYLTGSNGNPLVYFEANSNSTTGASAITGGESMLRRFIEQTSVLYKQVTVDGETGYIPYSSASNADIEKLVKVLNVAVPTEAVLTFPKLNEDGEQIITDGTGETEVMKLPERYRTLQFKTGLTAASTDLGGIYIATTEGFCAIGSTTNYEGDNPTISLTDANKALMQNVGFCNRYEAGAAYFNIPVKHYGWYRKGNLQPDVSESGIDWGQVLVGDFGVVRNHSYTINVTEITGIGTGIGGKDMPIVPPSNTKNYFVAYRVNILKWAVVPTQTVTL